MSSKDWNIKADKQKVLDLASKLLDKNCIADVEAKSIRVNTEIKVDAKGEMSLWCTVWTGASTNAHNESFYAFNDAKDIFAEVHAYVEEDCKLNSTKYVARETERLKEQLKATKKRLKDLGVKA